MAYRPWTRGTSRASHPTTLPPNIFVHLIVPCTQNQEVAVDILAFTYTKWLPKQSGGKIVNIDL